jgi:hypothetical protein
VVLIWHQLWFELCISVARNGNTEFALVRLDRLFAVAVAAILAALAGALAFFVPNMGIHLGFEANLH